MGNYIRKYCVLLLLILSGFVSYTQSVIYPDNSVLSSGTWYSVSVSQDGIYKLTYDDFRSLGVDEKDIDFDNLSIFGNTGKAISEINAQYTYSDLKENAVYVNKADKYVLFYAQATTQTIYDTTNNTFSFSLHPYAVSTKYFITFDKTIGEKKRIKSENVSSENIIKTQSTAQDYFYHKRELFNPFDAGANWLGENMMSTAPNLDIPIVLNEINAQSPIKVHVMLYAKNSLSASFNISLNKTDDTLISVAPISNGAYANLLDNEFIYNTNTSANTLNIKYNANHSGDVAYLDYITVNYTKNLRFNNNYLRFFSTDRTNDGVVKYVVDNVLAQNYMVWDVSDPTNVKSISDIGKENNSISFCVNTDRLHTLVVLAGSSFDSPVLEDTVLNQNLHALDTCDFVIVTHPNFRNQADSLAQIHRIYDNIRVAVVNIDEVYNEFSSGTKDFLAIREFIRMMYNKSDGKYPTNVLLFGDGTFDNKNILQYNNNFIPTYQSNNSIASNDMGITSDDVLAAIKDDSRNRTFDSLMVGIGRLPANDTVTAKIMVDKCLRYITKSDLRNKEKGSWRNSAMLTSDDADVAAELYFIDNAESIYRQIDQTHPGLNITKVYQDAYKEYTSSSGATYPDASNKVNDRLKKGCLLLNYLGHGSPDHLSGERLISITDITSWNNYNKLCLMITSTCEFNRFDLAAKQAAGEYIVQSENGGGIALIAAARKISSNDPINRNLHRFALERRSDGKACTFGEVMKNAKNATTVLQYSERSISLIGDPALRVALPDYNINTLQVNNSFFDTLTAEMDKTDTIKALSDVVIKGEITDWDGKRIENFNGTVEISLYDKKSTYYTLNNANVVNGKKAFEQQVNILHKGETTVENGVFTYEFQVPRDIAYNYGFGKLSYYAQNDSTDATGYFNEFIIGGIDTTAGDLAECRPTIGLYMNDTNFVSGGITDENPSLFAVIKDSIPINTVGSGLGHDIVARLDNAANTFILNDFYLQDESDNTVGYITYPFNNLSSGEHTLTLKVWNIYNFSSEKTITFNVVQSDEEKFVVLNYPNPFKHSTTIELRYNTSESVVSANLYIYDRDGRVIKHADVTDKIGTYNIGPIEWDGCNDAGARVSQGLYPYSIVIKTQSNEKVIHGNKMVVLN